LDNSLIYRDIIVLDDKIIYSLTPTWIFKALRINIPLEYIIEE